MLTHAAKADLVRRCEMLIKVESMQDGIDSPARILRDLISRTRSEDFAPDALCKIPVGPCTDIGDGLGLPERTLR
jgi:hypothetical protein